MILWYLMPEVQWFLFKIKIILEYPPKSTNIFIPKGEFLVEKLFKLWQVCGLKTQTDMCLTCFLCVVTNTVPK